MLASHAMTREVDNDFSRNDCPLCHSLDVRKVGRGDYFGITRFSTCDIALSKPPEIWACAQCGSGFTQNILPEPLAKSLYSSASAGERWSSTPFDRLKTPEVVAAMTALFTGKGRVLDVGCNTGELLDFAATSGCTTSGLEYSAASREVIMAKGHAAYQSFADVPGQFDVITGFDLIEHLYDVPEFLNVCHEKLLPSGKLVLLTGDIGSFSAKLAGSHWWYAQYPEHIVFPARCYFASLRNYALEGWLPTYAAAAYRYPMYWAPLAMIKQLASNGHYNGQPSLLPDHALITLIKLDV